MEQHCFIFKHIKIKTKLRKINNLRKDAPYHLVFANYKRMGRKQKLETKQCRTCYNATKGLRLLTNLIKCGGKSEQKSYAELITEVSNINIMEDSCKEMPKFICDVCSRKLKLAHSFIQQAHEVNERLNSMLIGLEEADKQLDCLQEAQLDIRSCLEIKMEYDNTVENDEIYQKFHVKLKMEETEEYLQNNILDEDVLCEKNNVGQAELIGLEKALDVTNIETIKNPDNLKSNSARDSQMKNKSELSPCFHSEDNESGSDNYEVNNGQEIDLESQKDDEKDISLNSNNEVKNDFKIYRKPEEVMENLPKDYDVAVPCSQCNKIFNNSKALMRHQRTSHIPEDQKCTCPLCFRKFSRSCNMYTHMRTFHGPDTVPLIRKPSTQERIFQCDRCPRNYTKKKHLNIHIKNKHSQETEICKEKSNEYINYHDEETPAKSIKPKRYEVRSLCSICGSSFSSKTHLIVHMRRHTGERPFKCDLCDRAYPRISELTCHRRIHTGEKPFACKICGKTFRVSSKMTTHMRSHTDIRPYKCTQCERSFKYSKDLSIHFRIHTGERPYKCNVCGSTFTQSNTLKAHRVKLGHTDNVLEIGNNL